MLQSLADLHAISWLARLVLLAGGKKDATGVESLESKGIKVGPKVRSFWASWIERPSFKRV